MRHLWVASISLALLGACGEAPNEVLALVVDVHVSSECADAEDSCWPTGAVEFHHCGGDFQLIEEDTRAITAVSRLAPEEVALVAQLQHTGDYFPDGHGVLPQHRDFVLAAGDEVDVVAAHDVETTLYRLSADRLVGDVAGDLLVAAEEDALIFEYATATWQGATLTAVERHALHKRTVEVTTSSPDALKNACCTAARPSSGVLAALVILVALRRQARARERRAKLVSRVPVYR